MLQGINLQFHLFVHADVFVVKQVKAQETGKSVL